MGECGAVYVVDVFFKFRHRYPHVVECQAQVIKIWLCTTKVLSVTVCQATHLRHITMQKVTENIEGRRVHPLETYSLADLPNGYLQDLISKLAGHGWLCGVFASLALYKFVLNVRGGGIISQIGRAHV